MDVAVATKKPPEGLFPAAVRHARELRAAVACLREQRRPQLDIDPKLPHLAGAIDADAWMKWCEENFSPREVRLMQLADAADRPGAPA